MNLPPMPFETRDRRRLAFAPDARIDLTNDNGSVTVTGWDRPEVSLEIVTRADKKEKLTRVVPTLETRSDRFTLNVVEKYLPEDSGDWRRDGTGVSFWPALTTLTLFVPHSASVKIRSRNADLTLSRLLGSVEADAYNGTLRYRLSHGASQEIAARTFNGRLILPEPTFRWTESRRREAVGVLGDGAKRVILDSYNGTVEVR